MPVKHPQGVTAMFTSPEGRLLSALGLSPFCL